MKYICKTCYREFIKDRMVKSISGTVTDICKACNYYIGKGDGYSGASESMMNKWFEGLAERKKELIKRGRLNS